MDGDRPDAAIPELNALPVRKEESASFTNGWNITGRFAVAKASSTSPSLPLMTNQQNPFIEALQKDKDALKRSDSPCISPLNSGGEEPPSRNTRPRTS